MKKSYVLAFFLLLFAVLSSAQSKYWLGGADDWGNPLFWSNSRGGSSCLCVPTSADRVVITNEPGGGTEIVTVPDSYVAYAEKVIVEEGSFLLVGSGSSGIGQLVIEDPSDDAMQLYGSVRVYDWLLIRDAPDRGIYVDSIGELDVKVGGFLDIRPNDAVVKHGIVNEGHVIVRTNSSGGEGLIQMFDLDGKGILNTGDDALFENKGRIHIEKTITTNDDGIYNVNDAEFKNFPSGEIVLRNINNGQSEGIDNRSTFVNQGHIEIRDVEQAAAISSALDASAVFVNDSGATIDIDNIGGNGIWTHSSGNFRNSGGITIDNLFGTGSNGIRNASGFDNLVNGQITITDVNGSGSRGVFSSSSFDNDGTLIIDDIESGEGLRNDGSGVLLLNVGTLTIKNTGSYGLYNLSSALVQNNGDLTIEKFAGPAIYCLTSSQFVNSGDITISSSQADVSDGIRVYSGSFTNTAGGFISILGIKGIGSQGIENQDTLQNNGTIEISEVQDEYAIYNGNGLLTNDGKITIMSSPVGGIRNSGSSSRFVNNDSLCITDLTGSSLGLLNHESATFENAAVVQISNIPGVAMSNLATFSNYNTLQISNISGSGLQNNGNIFNSSDIDISGTGSESIINNTDGSFTNSDCGVITVDHLLRNTGVFQNAGFIFQNENESGSNMNDSTFINTGVIEDRQGSFEAVIGSIQNTGYIAGPLHGYHVVGIPSQVTLLGAGSGISVSTEYYLESSITNSVGPFDQGLNQWTPTWAPLSSVYIEMRNSCHTRTIRQDLDNATGYDCSIFPDTWIEFVPSSGNWHWPFNWSNNQVPTYCTKIRISSPKNINIPNGKLGMAKVLEVMLGASCNIDGMVNVIPNIF